MLINLNGGGLNLKKVKNCINIKGKNFLSLVVLINNCTFAC